MPAKFFSGIEIGFVGFGIWLTLAFLVPVLCVYSVRLRSIRSADLKDSVFEHTELKNSTYYQQYISINHLQMWSKTWLPILLIFLFSIYFSTLLVFTFHFVFPASQVGNFIFLGHDFGSQATITLDGTLRNNME